RRLAAARRSRRRGCAHRADPVELTGSWPRLSSRTSRTRRAGWRPTGPWSPLAPTPCSTIPLAERVAGERGRAIAAASPRLIRKGWTVITRTKLIDDLVQDTVRTGCGRVLNLAAGMDTRPYRLPLPPSLRWIEADLPGIVDEKERLLAGETPACELVRERVDLADAGARPAFLARAVGDAPETLVITEGLLGYLDAAVVAALARDLAAPPGRRLWILDLFSPGALRRIKNMRGHMAAPLLGFAPPEGVAFFEPLG